VAVVLGRHGVEHGPVATGGRFLGHARIKLPAEKDGGTISSFEVGGHGKPVGIRRGPATVIGDAVRTRATGDDESPGRRGR
jgi:hypothetical protein